MQEVSHPLQISDDVELLGSPIFGSSKFFDDFTVSLFDKVHCLQDLLPRLEDPQMELQLLRQCLSCCKIVHILRTVPPHLLIHLSDFDNQLRSSLSHVVRHSLSDLTWQQATLSMRLGGLGIRLASDMVYAAYLDNCSDFKDLVRQLLGIRRDSDFMLVGEATAQQNLIGLLPSTFNLSPASQTDLQLHLDEHFYSEVLLQQSIRDRALLLALSDSSDWLLLGFK